MSYIPALTKIPATLPPLERAYHLLEAASDAGFKWPNAQLVLGKIREELAETEEAIASGDKTHAAEEIGDVLSATINLARFQGVDVRSVSLNSKAEEFAEPMTAIKEALQQMERIVAEKGDITQAINSVLAALITLAECNGIDAEAALAATNNKFTYRFNAVEKRVHAQGQTMQTTPLKEMIGMWNQCKDSPEAARSV